MRGCVGEGVKRARQNRTCEDENEEEDEQQPREIEITIKSKTRITRREKGRGPPGPLAGFAG